LGATPTPALSVFLRFCWQFGSQRREPSKPSFGHDPSFPLVRSFSSGLRTGISFRVLLSSQCASPHSRSARPSSSCRPSGLRKRQRNFPGSCFVKVPHFIGAHPSHSSAPRFRHRVHTSRHGSSPPMPLAVAGIKRCPRHSRRFRTPIVVCAAWSFLRDRLTPAPSSGKSSYRLFFQKQTFPNSNPATIQNHTLPDK